MKDKIVKEYEYECLMELINFAETLGWEDKYPDNTDPDFDDGITDAIEEDCIDFIERQGYTVYF